MYRIPYPSKFQYAVVCAGVLGLCAADGATELADSPQIRINGVFGRTQVQLQKLQLSSELADASRESFHIDFSQPSLPGKIAGSKTVVRVKGAHPYTLYFERYEQLDRARLFESAQAIPRDVGIKRYAFDDGGADVIFQYPATGEARLRVLNEAVRPAGVQLGGPALIEAREDSKTKNIEPGSRLVLPSYTRTPGFTYMQLEDPQDICTSKWVNDRKVLQIAWHDQVDEFNIDVDSEGQLSFVMRRSRGEHAELVLGFGSKPEEPGPQTKGNLIGHWSFDKLSGNGYEDLSGRGHHAMVNGGIQSVPGIRGQGIYGVRSTKVPLGESVTPDGDDKVPGELQFGHIALPQEVLEPVRDAMTICFWYAQPKFTANGYRGYIRLQEAMGKAADRQVAFGAEGFFTMYNMWHFLGGQRITAEGVGNHRLFGMYGPSQERDRWSFYTVVVDQKVARMYINGELEFEEAVKVPLSKATKAFESVRVLQNMWGTMDELKIFDYPLSAPQIRDEFEGGLANEMVRFDFEGELVKQGDKLVIRDARNNPHRGSGIEVVPSHVGQGLKFSPEGGRLEMSHAINAGKPLNVLTFSAWVKLPEGFKGRVNLFNTQTGHAGMEVGFWGSALWGRASQNVYGGAIETGKWAHVIVSYGYNRLAVWVNGTPTSDIKDAYPSAKGWQAIAMPYVLSFDQALEIDELRILNYFPDEAVVEALYSNKTAPVPQITNAGFVERRVIQAVLK